MPDTKHGWTVYNWLTDLLEPPPWDYSHMHYVNGAVLIACMARFARNGLSSAPTVDSVRQSARLPTARRTYAIFCRW